MVESEIPTLSYATPGDRKGSRIRRWTYAALEKARHFPRFFVALVGLLVVMAFFHFLDFPYGLSQWEDQVDWDLRCVVLCLPLFLHTDWRHRWYAPVGSLGLIYLWQVSDVSDLWWRISWYPWIALPNYTVIPLAVGLAACVATRRNERPSILIGWTLMMCLGFGLLHFTANEWLQMKQFVWRIPQSPTAASVVQVSSFLFWPGQIAVTWIAIGVAALIVSGKHVWPKWVGIGGLFLGVSGFLLFSLTLWTRVEDSVDGRGPYDQSLSIGALADRGKPQDITRIWAVLEQADLSAPVQYSDLKSDYRLVAVRAIVRVEGDSARDRLRARFGNAIERFIP